MNWSNYELAHHSIFHVPKNAIAQLPQASLDVLDIPFVYVSFVRLHVYNKINHLNYPLVICYIAIEAMAQSK
jgi:hypothetical protein